VLLKVIGLLVSSMLLMKEVGLSSAKLQHFCKIGNHIDCNVVLHSRLSNIKGITLADTGFVYFAFGILYLLLSYPLKGLADTVEIIMLFSILCIPYTLFAIGYQFYLRKWCLFCLAIISVILCELLPCATIGSYWHKLNYMNVYIVFFSLLFAVCLLILFRKIVSFKVQKADLTVQNLTIKRNKSFFFLQSIKIDHSLFKEEHGLCIGDNASPIKITTILSPFCSKCRISALQMISLYKQFPNLIQWNICFLISENIENSKLSQILLSLIYLYNRNKEVFLEAIEFWFIHFNYDILKKKFKICLILTRVYTKLNSKTV
jgi:uncharacterized membrane protein